MTQQCIESSYDLLFFHGMYLSLRAEQCIVDCIVWTAYMSGMPAAATASIPASMSVGFPHGSTGCGFHVWQSPIGYLAEYTQTHRHQHHHQHLGNDAVRQYTA